MAGLTRTFGRINLIEFIMEFFDLVEMIKVFRTCFEFRVINLSSS